jgi:hypothetical protein
MKKLFAIAVLSVLVFSSFSLKNNNALLGSWILEKDQLQHVLLFTNKHYSYTIYDLKGKKFHHTEGGTYSHNNSKLETILEFNSTDRGVMGKQTSINAAASKKELKIDWPVAGSNWKRIDNGGGPLNATWRITGREQEGKMNTIQKSARKTIKIMTGDRFQWAAINTATGEFFGTGGGTYTFKDGRYTEQIEFFSRDSSRVGMSLSFEGKVNGGDWHHRGKSSKGDPIYEIWSKED